MIRFSEGDLLDSTWGHGLTDADVGLALRLTGLVLRRGYNGVEMGYVEKALPGAPRALDTSALEKAGICKVHAGRLTLNQTWLYRRLPDRIARRLMTKDMTGEPVEGIDAAPARRTTRKADAGDRAASPISMRSNDDRRIANPKGPRDLFGEEVDRFLAFWDAFGHKFGRAGAIKEWVLLELAAKRGDSGVDFPRIIRAAGIEAFMRSMRRNSTPKYAEGWLSERRYNDDGYEQDPRVWSPSEQTILAAATTAAIFEEWTEVTPGRRDAIRRAVTQLDNDPGRVAQYLTFAAQYCSWDSFLSSGGRKNGKVPLAVALSPQVMTAQREFLRALRARKSSPAESVVVRATAQPDASAQVH